MTTQTFQTPGRLELEIQVASGTVHVDLRETDETRLEISGEHDPDQFRIALDEVPGGQRLTIEQQKRGRIFGWNSDHLTVDVVAPTGTQVSCDTGSADLTVNGAAGSLAFRSGSGDCRFDEVTGDVSVKTASGDVQGESAGRGLTVNTASGDVHVRSVVGNVVARTASGDVRLGHVDGGTDGVTVSGDVEIGALSTGVTSIKTVSGDVEIGVAAGARLFLDLSSTSGSTSSDLDMGEDATGDGATDAELRATTVSGDIRVTRAR